jgi:hypothetical protein
MSLRLLPRRYYHSNKPLRCLINKNTAAAVFCFLAASYYYVSSKKMKVAIFSAGFIINVVSVRVLVLALFAGVCGSFPAQDYSRIG